MLRPSPTASNIAPAYVQRWFPSLIFSSPRPEVLSRLESLTLPNDWQPSAVVTKPCYYLKRWDRGPIESPILTKVEISIHRPDGYDEASEVTRSRTKIGTVLLTVDPSRHPGSAKELERTLNSMINSFRKADAAVFCAPNKSNFLLACRNPILIPDYLAKDVSDGLAYEANWKAQRSLYRTVRNSALAISGQKKSSSPVEEHFEIGHPTAAGKLLPILSVYGFGEHFVASSGNMLFRKGDETTGILHAASPHNLEKLLYLLDLNLNSVVPGYLALSKLPYFQALKDSTRAVESIDQYGTPSLQAVNCCVIGDKSKPIIIPLQRPPEELWRSTNPEISGFIDRFRGLHYIKQENWLEYIETRLINCRVVSIEKESPQIHETSGPTGPRQSNGKKTAIKTYNFAEKPHARVKREILGRHFLITVLPLRDAAGTEIKAGCAIIDLEGYGALRIFKNPHSARAWLNSTPAQRESLGLHNESYRISHGMTTTKFVQSVNAEIEKRTGLKDAGTVRLLRNSA